MWGSVLLTGFLTLITCTEAYYYYNRIRPPTIDRDDGKHIMSLTMCLAHMSGMNNNFTMVDTSPVTDESSRLTTPQCKKNGVKYRTITGECNNILRPAEGQSLSRFKRYVKPNYKDGIGAPRVYSVGKRCFWGLFCYNVHLPSARTVSCAIHPSKNVTSIHSVMLMQWGQFMDHDMTATAVQQPDMSGSDDDCCKHRRVQFGLLHPDSFKRNGRCFPIPIVQQPADPVFKSNCVNFVRSRPVNPEFSRRDPREQQNLLSSFIDASNVYGSNEETVKRLRGLKGKMKTSTGDLLPRGNDGSCILPKNKFCFDAGDERVNVFPGLTALHTVFVRFHNYIVTDLTKHNRLWDGERFFQEARKIVGAILQRITYTEFLPKVLSASTMKEYKLKAGGNYKYKSSINPSIASVFSTAAFRYGHSLIPDFLVIDGKQVKSRRLFNNPKFIFTSLKSVVENILSNPALLSDRFMSSETTEHLFEEERGGPFDLAAFNIQRGRDHGLPSYNAFRKLCKLSPITKLPSPLEGLYRDVEDVDVWAGGMTEESLPGSELGPLFNCILGMQFRDLKFGDSFWYETKDKSRGFTSAQLRAIQRVSLSEILCQVLDLAEIQRDPFRTETRGNRKSKCKKRSALTLSPWYDH